MQNTIEYKNAQDLAEHLAQWRFSLVRKLLVLSILAIGLLMVGFGMLFGFLPQPTFGIIGICLASSALLLGSVHVWRGASRDLVSMSTEVLEGDDCVEMLHWMEQHPYVAAYITMVNDERAVTQYDRAQVRRWIAAQTV